MLTAKAEAHLARVKGKINSLIDAKFRAGAEEHSGNGNLEDHPDLDSEIRAELLDLVNYAFTRIEQLESQIKNLSQK